MKSRYNEGPKDGKICSLWRWSVVSGLFAILLLGRRILFLVLSKDFGLQRFVILSVSSWGHQLHLYQLQQRLSLKNRAFESLKSLSTLMRWPSPLRDEDATRLLEQVTCQSTQWWWWWIREAMNSLNTHRVICRNLFRNIFLLQQCIFRRVELSE